MKIAHSMVVLVGFVAALCAPVSSSAAGERPRPAQTDGILGGHNVFHGSSSRRFIVDLPKPATFRVGGAAGREKPAPSLHLSGPGRVLALVLTEYPPSSSRPLIAAAGFRACGAPGCTEGPLSRTLLTRGSKSRLTLPAGRYAVYLVADDHPVEATLELEGPSGSKVFRRGDSADVLVEPMQEGVVPPGAGTHSGGVSYPWDRSSILFSTLWLRSDVAAGPMAWGRCNYEGPPDLPEPIAYSPACHVYETGGRGNASGSDVNTYGPPVGSAGPRLFQLVNVEAPSLATGTMLSHGLWASMTGTVVDSGTLAVRLSY